MKINFILFKKIYKYYTYFIYILYISIYNVLFILFNRKLILTYMKYILKFLNTKYFILNNKDKIKNGFIISNHSSFIDFVYDIYITDTII